VYSETAIADSMFVSGHYEKKEGDVDIGAGVWIGANVFIGPDVTIGQNAVVGANSVVTRSIPADEIWGGVPARLIRRKHI
jgi:maltose O-acetyltransferase